MKDASGNWVSAEGKTLDFVKAADAKGEAILWEPGCTYTLPELRVVNNGNLALKYKVTITGINGSAKLNEAIEWTIGDVAMGAEQHLKAGESNEFTIKGHMKESAGNEYMNESIDGIAITVAATQDTVENDSLGNTYDEDAEYPIVAMDTLQELINNATLPPLKVMVPKFSTVCHLLSTPAARVKVPPSITQTAALRSADVLAFDATIFPVPLLSFMHSVPWFKIAWESPPVSVKPLRSSVTSLPWGTVRLPAILPSSFADTGSVAHCGKLWYHDLQRR